MRAWFVLAAVGCTQPATAEPTPLVLDPQLPTPMDVLVVIDDTSLAQTAAIPAPANLAATLEGIYNGAPDFRIAFTTSSSGSLRTSSSVPTGVIEHHVRVEDGSLQTNYIGDLAGAIQSLTDFTPASSANRLLAAATTSLDTRFTRPDAVLGVMLVSGRDDESGDEPSTYAAAIQTHATKAMVTAVHPAGTERIQQFLTGMLYRYQQTLEQYDMEAISSLAQLFQPASASSCFPLAVASGADCELATAQDHVSISLRACTDTTSPCFTLVEDASCASGWTITFGGAYRYYHPAVIGRCRM